jgi:ketosteroid isomerase-like protein
MSEQNVAVVRDIYAGWSRGDFTGGNQHFDPDVLFVLPAEFPEPGNYEGVEALREYTRGLLAPWSRFAIEAEELTDAGDAVVAAILQSGTGQESGTATEFRYFQVWWLRDGKVVRLGNYREQAEALEAVGL